MMPSIPGMRLFPPGVIVEEVAPLPVATVLLAEEEAAVARATAKRRREFSAGRLCARRALARLGVHGAALIAGPDRAPCWPAGVVGSITHTDRYCAAAVAPAARFAGIGIDAEPDEALEVELWDRICTAAELAWLWSRDSGERGRFARLIFSAKECLYKCQYPLTRALLDFHDVTVAIDPARQRFTATWLTAVGEAFPVGRTAAGSYLIGGGLIRTAMALPATARASSEE